MLLVPSLPQLPPTTTFPQQARLERQIRDLQAELTTTRTALEKERGQARTRSRSSAKRGL